RTGDKGDTGDAGANGTNGTDGADGVDGGGLAFNYEFDTSTADSNPGTGLMRFNNGTYSSVTEFYISVTDKDTNSLDTVFDTFDDSTSPNKGYLRVMERGNPAKWVLFYLTAVETETGYKRFLLDFIDDNGGTFPDTDDVIVIFTPNGDK